jgi:hypothetical protein
VQSLRAGVGAAVCWDGELAGEDDMLAYLRLVALALLAITAISVATVAPVLAIDVDSYSFGAS